MDVNWYKNLIDIEMDRLKREIEEDLQCAIIYGTGQPHKLNYPKDSVIDANPNRTELE